MKLTEEQQELVDRFREHPDDTGSAQVQVALLTFQISNLTEHLREHPSDHTSRRGLLKMVGKRKRLLEYLQREKPESFSEVVSELNIRVKAKPSVPKEIEITGESPEE
ncbi:MAG: 30S ribosomal protein S15 [Candidatus Bipolaricaulota bacterium]